MDQISKSSEFDRHRLPCVRGSRLRLNPRDPGLDDPDIARRWVSELPRPWAVDLFCGAGGLSLGLELAGLNIVAAADQDAIALETHNANVGGLAWQGDLSEPTAFLSFLSQRGVAKADVVAGGPPCQPFSRAGRAKIRSLIAVGKRSAADPRIRAWQAYAEVVRELDPRIVLLENVPDLARWEDGRVLAEIHGMLRELGYEPHTRMIQGEEMGVPQHRMRLFIVGVRHGSFSWPRRRAKVDLRSAIGDLPQIAAGQRLERIPYVGPKSPFQKRARRGVFKADRDHVFDHFSRDVRKDDLEAFELLGEGDTYADLPDRLRRYRSDIFTDKYKRLSWGSVARTITAHIAKDGYWYIHPEQPRTLSIREAARIQTFPDWFRFAGHPTTQLRQIGNAVPPVLARAVGLRVVACLEGQAVVRSATDLGSKIIAWQDPRSEVANSIPRDPWKLAVAAVVLGARNWEVVHSRIEPILNGAETPAAALNGNWTTICGELDAIGRTSRAEPLRRLATAVLERGGDMPNTEAELAALPYISQHAAAWIASAAFDKQAVILDAGTRRIAGRVSGRDVTSDWDARLEILVLAGPTGPVPEFNEAVRELARTVCRPGRPRCGECPLSEACASSKAGRRP